ncbi:hypothetical protein [Paenibacillus sp. HJGM_3]|uniref:hypothetical protein n=1 Tax=Paenibacillus sp. HJGM_3 TaxID=3379816 RepID=UPI00385E7A65
MNDSERKLARILWNLNQSAWAPPDFPRICRMTGRTEAQIRESIKLLIEVGAIEVRPGELRVLKT